jgi:hypothetical protein
MRRQEADFEPRHHSNYQPTVTRQEALKFQFFKREVASALDGMRA